MSDDRLKAHVVASRAMWQQLFGELKELRGSGEVKRAEWLSEVIGRAREAYLESLDDYRQTFGVDPGYTIAVEEPEDRW